MKYIKYRKNNRLHVSTSVKTGQFRHEVTFGTCTNCGVILKWNGLKGGMFGMEWFNVGRIVNTHGIRGEVRVLSSTDFEEVRFAPGSKLAVFKKDENKPTWVTVESSRRHKNFILLMFEGYDNINLVEPFKEGLLKVTKDQLADDELEENEYYYFEIMDCEVFSEEGEKIGTVSDILQTGANDVWEVKAPNGKKHYIPYIEEIVKEIDVEEKKITIHVMEGLL